MPRKSPQLAKLARPVADGLVERPRLFNTLDQARHQRTAWVMAPAGSGKTSLVTSYLESRKLPCLWYQIDAGDADLATFFHYLGIAAQAQTPRKQPLPKLTPEYLPSLEAYVRRFFQLLFQRLPSPFVLVLDNYHDAPVGSALHTALATALNEIPPENTVLFISRYAPPAPLARGFTNSALISWEDLKLTQEEAAALLTRHGHPDPDALQPFIDAAQGWAAGLVLLARTQGNKTVRLPSEIHELQTLHDYFEQEILNRIPAESHDILLKTALFPVVTPEIAQKITGSRRAANIIATLHRERYFIDRHSGITEAYSYHPLFKVFLLKHGQQRYSGSELSQLKQSAAKILEENGQIEAAIDLFIETGKWDECARLIVFYAPQFLEQGRNLLFEGWILKLPASERDRNPWLLYWAGMCRMPFNPPESRLNLEAAFLLFKARTDATGLYIALGAILSSFFFEWNNFTPADRWINELDKLLAESPGFPSVEAETQVAMGMLAIMFRCPQHRLVRIFMQRISTLLRLSQTPRQKCAVINIALLHSLWSGDLVLARTFLDALKDTLKANQILPLDAITINISTALLAYLSAAHDEAYSVLGVAFEIAQTSGVHLLDVQIFTQEALTALSEGQFDKATAVLLAKIQPILDQNRLVDVAVYRLVECSIELAKGKVTNSMLDKVRTILDILEDAGGLYGLAHARLALAEVNTCLGDHIAARREFALVKAFAQEMPSDLLFFQVLIDEANSLFITGENELALVCLRQALKVGRVREYRNCHPFSWRPKVMSRLFANALEAGIEVEYVQYFIRVRNLKSPSLDVSHWPWLVQIFTLGRFSILINNQELSFKAKAPKKPLELLKCLISHGSEGVFQNTLIYELWPDLDGDAGRNAFDLALHRLRKLLSCQDAIDMQDGRLKLNQTEVWVDAWSFDRLCTALETEKSQDALSKDAQRLLNLYRGQFLEGDDHAWLLTCRERLNSKFIRMVGSLAQKLISETALDDAIALYRQAIEFDPLIEEFHRGLMQCYQVQGKIAEALVAYRHCQDMLSIVLGIQPSQQTLAVYRSLKSSS